MVDVFFFEISHGNPEFLTLTYGRQTYFLIRMITLSCQPFFGKHNDLFYKKKVLISNKLLKVSHRGNQDLC